MSALTLPVEIWKNKPQYSSFYDLFWRTPYGYYFRYCASLNSEEESSRNKCVRVWAELCALTTIADVPPLDLLYMSKLREEIELILEEMMIRVRNNIIILRDRLIKINYPTSNKEVQTQMYKVVDKKTEERYMEAIKSIESQLGIPIPLSLKYFWKIVGEVRFGPKDWSDKEFQLFWGRDSYGETIQADPLVVWPPTTAEVIDLDWDSSKYKKLIIADSGDDKAFVSGEGPVGFFLDDRKRIMIDMLTDIPLYPPSGARGFGVPYIFPTMDDALSYWPYEDEEFSQIEYLTLSAEVAQFLNMEGRSTFTQSMYSLAGIRARLYICGGFVDYLRHAILETGGFPALMQYKHQLSEDKRRIWEQLREGLQPF